MGLITRQIGPDAKGSKLTFTEMDNNLYYLQSLGVSGLTYSAGTLTTTNPTGGTLSVNIASDTNTFITAATYNQSTNTVTLTDNTNTNFNAYINAVSGLTVNGILSATTISGGTLYGDGSNLTGISSGSFFTGGTVSGSTQFTNGLTANTISATTYLNLPISGLTEGANINVSGFNGNYTISFTGNGTNDSSLYSLPVPNLKIQKTPTTIESLDTNSSYVGYNQIGSGVTFDLTAVVITNDISEEQINNGVWLEMLLYRRNKKNQKNAKGFVVPPSYSWDGSTSANTLQNELLSLYPTLKITSRGGGTLYYNQYTNITEPLKVSRPNHQKVTGITQTINVTNYLNGRFTYRNIPYRNENGQTESTTFKVPFPLKIQGSFVSENTSNRFCYAGKLTPTYATFRYIMFNPNINNSKGGFITGPLSKTLKVTLERFPLIPSTPVYKFGKFYSTCTLDPNYSGFENKLRFSIESNVP